MLSWIFSLFSISKGALNDIFCIAFMFILWRPPDMTRMSEWQYRRLIIPVTEQFQSPWSIYYSQGYYLDRCHQVCTSPSGGWYLNKWHMVTWLSGSLISNFHEWHLAESHSLAPRQVITFTVLCHTLTKAVGPILLHALYILRSF